MTSTPPALVGPAFGSYAPDEVSWLLTDLSGVALEAPVEEREEAIQSGRAHYAQSLPIEYQPTAEYQQLFLDALEESADRLARSVGLVSELVRAELGRPPVLVSLARAGTPVGALMRRWFALCRGEHVAHYTISIIRGRGIDELALRHIAETYDSADVVFVDGWTGKGAIVRELTAAVEAANAAHGWRFDPTLAVLADTGACTSRFGTRADFLIPSACLNSTVSGLVSRTVLNDELIGPADYHGAKFYAELSGSDLSRLFLDTVSARFGPVAKSVDEELPALLVADRTPSWVGWREVERIQAEYGIGSAHLVKPGVGETTRVLLRRVPWQVLVRPDRAADLGHVRMLAEQRGVPIVEVDELAYSCVGLIQPEYRRS